MSNLSYLEIADSLHHILAGDTVYVISDLMTLIQQTLKQKETFDTNLFIDSLIQKVGPDGTLLFPTFSWDFCKGIPFDYHKTPGRTGALGNAALARPDFRRTKHPLYSFAVWGKDQNKYCEMDPPDSFGEGTIFDCLHKQNAKALVIGLHPLDGFTFLHHVEQAVGVPYRFHKTFTAPYTDENGATREKSYRMYVRDLDLDATEHSEPLEQILKDLNIIRTQTFDKTDFHTIFLSPAFDVEAADIRYNDCRNIYSYKGQPMRGEDL